MFRSLHIANKIPHFHHSNAPCKLPAPTAVSYAGTAVLYHIFGLFYGDFQNICKQHIRRPHDPLILAGFRLSPCSFAILMDTGWKFFKNRLQQNG